MSTYQKLFRLQGIDSKDVHLKGLTGQFTLQEIKMTMINIISPLKNSSPLQPKFTLPPKFT